MNQEEKLVAFRSLHRKHNPLILVNTWDIGSTAAVAKSGAKAIGTASWSIAAAAGLADGEAITRDAMMSVLKGIAGSTDLPVTADLEGGYGDTPNEVAETVRLSILAGAVGCNLEDSRSADRSLRTVSEAADRIRAARHQADQLLPGFFINARCDVFFGPSALADNNEAVEALIHRAQAYADAGADGIFVPGLTDLAVLRHLAAQINLPLNVMRMSEDLPLNELAETGVSRISHGPFPYLVAMKGLERVAAVAR